MNSPGGLFFIHAVICDRCVGRQFDIWKSPLRILPIPFPFSAEIIRSFSLILSIIFQQSNPSSLLLRFIQRLTSIQIMSGVLKRATEDTYG